MVTYGIILNSPKFRNFLHKDSPSLHTLFIAVLTPEVTALNSKTSHEQQYVKVRNSWLAFLACILHLHSTVLLHSVLVRCQHYTTYTVPPSHILTSTLAFYRPTALSPS